MNIIEHAKAILRGDVDHDPMVIVRSVARLETVAFANIADILHGEDYEVFAPRAYEMGKNDVYLYTLEADK